MNSIKKRTIIISSLLAILALYAVYHIVAIITNESFVNVTANQSKYKTTITTSRGIIYDCNLEPITNTQEVIIAVAVPTIQSLSALSEVALEEIDIDQVIKDGKMFTTEVSTEIVIDGVEFFTISKRYEDNFAFSNLIGYTDSSGQGVTGIEKIFDETLSENSGEIAVTYSCNALGQVISGDELDYQDTYSYEESGIALTIDSELQEFIVDISEEITTGAVVVTEIQTGNILAMVSLPSYDPNNLSLYLSDEDSPMINRCTSSFAPGSIFKLVMAAAGLENGLDYNETYTCTGSIIVDGMEVNCFNSTAHGEVNLHLAIQKSCNCYFINMAQNYSPEIFLNTATLLGLGQETVLYEDYTGSAGNLTDLETLESTARALSNFSIGQGDVSVTPVQMASVISTIASGGVYQDLNIYKGVVDSDGNLLSYDTDSSSVDVMDSLVSLRLMSYMESAVKYGTATAGYSELYTSGAKTGTAETEMYEDGEKLYNYWYCGYVGQDDPEYAIVVLNESAIKGDNPTGEIFKNIGEYIYK